MYLDNISNRVFSNILKIHLFKMAIFVLHVGSSIRLLRLKRH